MNVLIRKQQKVLSYRRRRIIGASDPVVIAVNGRRAAMYRGDSNPSFIERACLGVGSLQVEFEIGRGAVSSHLAYKPTIGGGERAPVTTIFLEDPTNPRTEISGVIFSMVGMENHAGLRDGSLLHDLLLLPNRAAENPVPPEIALKIATSQLQLRDESSGLLTRIPPGR